MKKVITTVGTSLFVNYNEIKKENINEDIKDESFSEYTEWKDEIADIKQKLLIFATDDNSSAEMTSILKLKEEFGDIEVYLIATDTIESIVICEVIKEALDNKDIIVHFNMKQDIINDLQVKNYRKFKNGLSNLINRLYKISSNYYDNLILNITGGYKAVVPYLTIFGQVNSIPLYYIFENSNSLISIPKIPLSIDEGLFDKYWKEFEELTKDEIIEKSSLHYSFLTDMESLFEIDNELVALNPLGTILWRRYREKFFIFYAQKEVLEEIEKQNDIQRILETKFWQETRESKTERKDGHLVYDDGKNVNRIFYFSDDGIIYVYKTFDSNHAEYEKYINSSSVNKKEIKDSSQTKKIKKG